MGQKTGPGERWHCNLLAPLLPCAGKDAVSCMTILYQVFWTLPYEDKAPELCLFIFCKIPRAQIHWCLCEALPQSGSHFQDFADLLQPSVLPQLSLLSVALSSQQQRTQKSVEGSMDIFLIYNTGLSNLCARLWTPLTWLRSPSHFKYPLLHLRNTLMTNHSVS